MKLKQRGHRALIVACSVLLIFSLILAAIFLFIYFFSKKNIDYSADEMMFSSAHTSSVTHLYANQNTDSDGEYLPSLMEDVCYFDTVKEWMAYEEIPESVKTVFVSAEDRRFFEHSGVDLRRTAYAMYNTVFHRVSTFGASTITQQVIKNISGDNEFSIKRKLCEILRARHLEKRHTKEEILEMYLNVIPLGENLVGIGSGAKTYFGKEPSELSLAEAATLAGITNAPTRYNPYQNPSACLEKRNRVLYAVHDAGYIDRAEYEKLCKLPLGTLARKGDEDRVNSWFAECVMRDIAKDLCKKLSISQSAAELLIAKGGLSVYTTADVRAQEILEGYFENESHFPSEVKNGLSFAMTVCDSKTGHLLATVGRVGKKTGNRLLSHATDIPHTPGSALKPIALYAPLIHQKRINAATVFDDVPVKFTKGEDGYTAYPQNYPRVYDGLTTVSDALRLSKNTVACRLYQMLGAENIYRTLTRDFGFSTLVRGAYTKDGARVTDVAMSPLALGQLSYGITLRELTGAYTVFSRDGVFSEPKSYLYVYLPSGELLLDNTGGERTVFSKESARIMNQLLMGVTESGTASKIQLKNKIDTAGKTGTSGEDRDRLFIGYTPYYTAGIWCGYDEGERAVGARSGEHLRIWDEVMLKLHSEKLNEREVLSFSTEGLIRRSFCKDSGAQLDGACQLDARGRRAASAYFTPDNCPRLACRTHVRVLYDTLTEAVAHGGCPMEDVVEISLLHIPSRSFPCEVYITDAQYVYRFLKKDTPIGDSYDVPYFIYAIPEGEFVGKSKSEKQFNSGCYLHSQCQPKLNPF